MNCVSANCTFEEGYCGWSNEDGDKLDWGRNYGSTLSANTGPSVDHTTQTDTGKKLNRISRALR